MSSFRAWGPKNNKAFALSVTAAAQVNATQPAGFANGGGQCQVYNSGTMDVLIDFYLNANGAPTLVFPVTGSPPAGSGGGPLHVSAIIPAGKRIQLSIPINADSFSAIGPATGGPSIVYVQRGDGFGT